MWPCSLVDLRSQNAGQLSKKDKCAQEFWLVWTVTELWSNGSCIVRINKDVHVWVNALGIIRFCRWSEGTQNLGQVYRCTGFGSEWFDVSAYNHVEFFWVICNDSLWWGECNARIAA